MNPTSPNHALQAWGRYKATFRVMPESWQKIIRSGTWLYDGTVPTGVHIVCQNYDYWYSLGQADNNLESDEQPTLNSDGLVYYALFGAVPDERPFGVRGSGFISAGTRHHGRQVKFRALSNGTNDA